MRSSLVLQLRVLIPDIPPVEESNNFGKVDRL